ncbi:winged helix-turn-helix transcriptional regulator [Candidatus Sumerlaeota bacterium]|nr:winged helix-turn-helix transcriptional regulator [Candidatus Sumerlaeota bacterium]
MSGDPKRVAALMRVLSVDTRVRIVQLLKGRSLCVNALAARLDVTQGAVSQHLRVMRGVSLVVDERRGCHVHYRLSEKTLATWRGEIDKLLDPRRGGRRDTRGASRCDDAMKRRRTARGRRG